MEIKNKTLINIINILDKYGSMKLPQKISYAITKNIIILKREFKIYNMQLKKIIESYLEYATKDENGKPKMYDNGLPMVENTEKSDELLAEVQDLLDISINVDLFKIDFETFNYDDKGVYNTLSSQDIMTLSTILCDEE